MNDARNPAGSASGPAVDPVPLPVVPSIPAVPDFMDLEVPDYAYMFGFIQADGHLQPGPGQKGRLSVEIGFRDLHILEAFARLTPYYSRIRERSRDTNFSPGHRSVVWTLCSLEARTTLNRLGMPYGKKSRDIAPPTAPFSVGAYLRGILDADGAVGFTGQGFPYVALATSSTAIARFYAEYAKRITGADRTVARNRRDQVYNILYCKEEAQALALDLYPAGALCLRRKQEAAESLRHWVRPQGMRKVTRRRWEDWEDEVLLSGVTLAAAARQLERSLSSCQLRQWRLRNGIAPAPLPREGAASGR
ncbi:LAGLIDADG family homing endonuclease [Streptomyces sp. SCSIO ZS0520]|uniref:LAGLIDADG family homing endonuclease n=1 Tax=Streptomyces sp. SCSIO ZS0520 TaxID=2892996 RepID=UPI0021D90199|nr:LAGLIDADG family homing endonuclease [Streptomyces sp. SCSIO ZS0520]